MSESPQRSARVVPIADQRTPRNVLPSARPSPGVQALPQPLPAWRQGEHLQDRLHRPLRDLRISVTDRCNFRCGYCMPRSAFGRDHTFLPQADLLSFEEITRAARLFLPLGVRKLRLTGGEPLLRKDLERLVEQLAQLHTLDKRPPDITLTTNASLLARKAQALKDAGLQRVTVSLDALNDAIFRQMSDANISVSDVLHGLDAAQRVGLGPIKVNMVVQRGVNDSQILPMARHFRGSGMELRFIEYMDVGATNRWQHDHVLPSEQVRALIHAEHPLMLADQMTPGATAQRWQYADGAGHVGFISSVTQAFCGDCTRLRLSTDGRLFTCLFGSQAHDLRSLLRQAPGDANDAHITARIAALWARRDDRYSQLRGQASGSPHTGGQRVEMSYIGG